MTYKADPVSEKLDKLAESTGFPRLSRRLDAGVPYRLRVLPLVLLGIVVIGLILQITHGGIFGFYVVMFAWIMTMSLQQWGPLRQPWVRGYDEREAALVRSGHFVGLLGALVVAILGSLAIGFGQIGAAVGLWSVWAPESGLDWIAIAVFLLVLQANLATFAASVAMPEPLDDDNGQQA